MNAKHECTPENAPRFRAWIQVRGGVAVWRSVNMSNLGVSWSTPALAEDGSPYLKPSWESASTPERIITDPSDIEVATRREVKRFRVGLRRGAQGLSIKLTDGAGRRLHAELEKAGEGAAYRFDYETQEAVVSVPAERVPLDLWIARVAS